MTRTALKTAMLESLHMNRSVVVVMVGYILSVFTLGRLVGFELVSNLYSTTWLVMCFATFAAVLISISVLQLYRYRPLRPLAFLRQLLVRDLRVLERGLIAVPCILLFPVFTSTYTSVKSGIWLMQPYSLDPLFARFDSTLHGGHAWELIHPVVGFPVVTQALNFAYNMWFFVAWGAFALVAVMTGNRALREQYLLAFCGCWILLGTLAATVFSSVGPCFYGLFYPGDPYAPLMSYLRSVDAVHPLWALATQDMLWQAHVSNSAGLGSGISAMPSIHLAVATLNALLLSRLGRIAGVLGWLYVVVILAGSIHLGWHYAIDGYVSILGMVLIWRAAGWWVARGVRPAPVLVALNWQGPTQPGTILTTSSA